MMDIIFYLLETYYVYVYTCPNDKLIGKKIFILYLSYFILFNYYFIIRFINEFIIYFYNF